MTMTPSLTLSFYAWTHQTISQATQPFD